MQLFWDTSAVLALIFAEPHSAAAVAASGEATQCYAWHWLRVEAGAGLARRRATATHWTRLEAVLEPFSFVAFPVADYPRVTAANRQWRLRAGDAGHLYCLQQTTLVLPEIQFVCFDEELLAAARQLRLRVWSESAAPTRKR